MLEIFGGNFCSVGQNIGLEINRHAKNRYFVHTVDYRSSGYYFNIFLGRYFSHA